MKRNALFTAAALFLGIVIVMTFTLIVKADYTQWNNDVYTSSPTWNNWPTTLAVILVEFPDVTHERFQDGGGAWHDFQAVYTWQNFYDMLASDNVYFSPDRYSPAPDNEAVFGSLRDYFGNMSNETYRPTIQILNDQTSGNPDLPPAWFMLPYSKSYYDGLSSSIRFKTITNHAITVAGTAGKDTTMNANRRFCIIYAGNRRTNINGAAYLGGDRYLMFERWKYVQGTEYTIEYFDAPLTHMGAHIHEFAHVRGFHHATTNRWGPLGDGQKNGPGPSFGACPAPLEPWFRSFDGWVTLTPITGEINDADLVYNGTPNNYMINLTRPSDGQAESFLVENRQFSSGYDIYLPGAEGGTGGPGGLLIWNIHGSNPGISIATDLIEADNDDGNNATSLPHDIFRPNGAYPYQKISDYSSPATLKFRDGTLSHFEVDDYTANDSTITVNFKTSSLYSNSSDALASNNGRKLVRDSGGSYHLVYETQGEVYYQKTTDGGASWGNYRRLSAGNGNNKFPSIAERGGRVYVTWQRFDGSSHDIRFRKSTDGGSTWANATEPASNVGSDPSLPVIISPATNDLFLVYRTGNILGWKRSTDDGASWASTGTISGSGLNSPSLAPITTQSGSTRSCLVFAKPSPSTIYYIYYRNGPDSSGWSGTLRNLSQIVPGTYNSHQKPSIAPSGASPHRRLHAVWEARNGTTEITM